MIVEAKYQLKAHQGAIYYLTNGPQDSVLSGGADRKVIQWDVEKGEGKILANSAATVMSLYYWKEKNWLFVGQTEGGVHLIDLDKKEEIKYLKGHDSYIFDILHLPKKKEILFSCADGSLSVWSTESFEMLYKRSVSQKKLRKLRLNQEGTKVLVSRGDDRISILDTKEFKELMVIKGDSSFNIAEFASDGEHILAGDKNAHLHQIRKSDGEIVKSLPAHYWAIYDLLFSPDQAYFATASRDKTVKVWDPSKLKVLARLEGRPMGGHTHSVNSLLWKDSKHLVSAGDDGVLRVWELKGQ